MGIPPSQVIPATPDIISGSPTPDISLEIAGITSSQIVPATPDVVSSPPSPDIPPASAGIPTPQIVPVTPVIWIFPGSSANEGRADGFETRDSLVSGVRDNEGS